MPRMKTLGATAPETDDARADFNTAVENNQPNLALHYAAMLFEDVYDRLDALETKSTTKKAPKKATTASKDESKDS